MTPDEADKRGRLLLALEDQTRQLRADLEAGDFWGSARAVGRSVTEAADRARGPAAGIPSIQWGPPGQQSAEWIRERLPPRQAVLHYKGKPWLLQGEPGLMLAKGGTGKSWALLQLAVAVATGKRWLDVFDADKGRVFVALAEEKTDEVRRRMFEIGAAMRLTEYEQAELMRNASPHGLSGQDVAMLSKGEKGSRSPSPFFESMLAGLEAAGPWRCILLDPWSRWSGDDVETDNRAATMGVQLLERLTMLPGSPCVIMVHHVRKSGNHDVPGDEADASRGSSALVDGVRWACNLTRMKGPDAPLELKVSKHNHTAPSEAVRLVRGEHGVLRGATPEEVRTWEAAHTTDGKSNGKSKNKLELPQAGGVEGGGRELD